MPVELTLIPLNERVIKQLILSGEKNFNDGQLEVRVISDQLNEFFDQFPTHSTFKDKESNVIFEVTNRQSALEENIIYLINALCKAEFDFYIEINDLIKHLEAIKETYHISITDQGCLGYIGQHHIIIPWEGNILLNNMSRCYNPLQSKFEEYQKELDFQPIFTGLEEQLTKKLSTLISAPLTEQEREIYSAKYCQKKKICAELFSEKNKLYNNLKTALYSLACSCETISQADIKEQWRWLEGLYCTPDQIFLTNRSILIKSAQKKRWTLEIKPMFEITLQTNNNFVSTIPLMVQLGPELAIQVCKLYGRRKIPSLIVTILDGLNLIN